MHLLIGFIFFVFTCTGFHDEPLGTYNIDWDLVQTEPRFYSSTIDLGECVCDLTWYACDGNCHCDPDCTAEHKSRFSDKLAEGPLSSKMLMCNDPMLKEVNARGAVLETFADNMLCVESEHSPTLGFFYELTQSVDDQLYTENEPDYVWKYRPPEPKAPSGLNDAFYMVGDPIGLAYVDSFGKLYQAGSKSWVVPAPYFEGLCSDSNFATFMQPEMSSCLRALPDLQQECVAGSTLSVQYYNVSRKAARYRTSTTRLDPQWISPVIVSWRYKWAEAESYAPPIATRAPTPFLNETSDTVAGSGAGSNSTPVFTNKPPTEAPTDSPTTAEPTVSPTPRPSASPTETPKFSNESLYDPKWIYNLTGVDVPPLFWNKTSLTCENAVTEVTYVFHYALRGTLEAVTIEYVLDNVEAGGREEAQYPTNVNQRFETVFNLTISGKVSRAKSGNPGYIVGKPILAGWLVYKPGTGGDTTSVTAIKQQRDGLTFMPVGEDHECLPFNMRGGTSISFGQDTLASCYVELTFEELRDICKMENMYYMKQYLNISTDYVGKWGDSDYYRLSDWLKIEYDATMKEPVFNEADGTCYLANRMNLEILTAKLGAMGNPQVTIIGARMTYGYSTWTFQSPDRSSANPQRLPIVMTVSFSNVDTGLEPLVLEGPPILPKIPYDVLYPLFIERADSGTSAVGCALALFMPWWCLLALS